MRLRRLFVACVAATAVTCTDSLAPELRDDHAAILVLVNSPTSSGELRRIEYGGASRATIIHDSAGVSYGSFLPSPDGSTLLYTMTPFTGALPTVGRVVLRGPSQSFTPRGIPVAWSPDGTQLLWLTLAGGGQSLLVSDANGNSPDTIALGEDPVWSPDGNRLFFSYKPNNTDDEIGVVDLTGPRTRVNLTNNPATDIRARLSPDGNWIAFVSGRSPGAGLYLMRPDGTQPHRIYAGTNLPAPHWSPDSRYLLVAVQLNTPPQPQDKLVVLDSAGTIHADIPFPLAGLAGVQWAPSSDVILVAAASGVGEPKQAYVISHDGRQRSRLTNEPTGIGAAVWIRR